MSILSTIPEPSMLSTTRAVELSQLKDSLESKIRASRRAQDNLDRIGNSVGAVHFAQKWQRMEHLLGKVRHRLELDAAILHWEKLAEAELEAEAWDIKVGVFSGGHSPYQFRADLYRRTAKALRIQAETGVAVCSCCFKPFGRGSLTH